MPVIDGVKVACIPCIRGHRSTKCTHDSERVMIPVRKPGRPLSSCPHQKGKLCNCNNITAAIPRNGKCGCGTSEPVITDTRAVVKTEPPTPEVAPMSPTRMASFRVQKHTTPKSPGRKQSFDISLLGQMDPSTINVMPSHSLTLGTNGNITHTSPMPSPAFIPNFHPNFSPGGPLGTHFEYSPMLGRLDGAVLNNFFENPHSTASNPSPTGLPSNDTSGHLGLDTSGTQRYTPIPQSPNSGSCGNGPSTKRRSCCSKVSTALPPAHEQLEKQKQPQDALGLMRYGNSLPSHSPDISALGFNGAMNNGTIMQHTPQNTIYTYPTSYGSSFYAPLQYSQWQEMMTSQAQSMPPENVFTASQSRIEAAPAMPSSYTAGQCGCGEDCQCLGCATHPFNAAMQEYVLSAMQDEQSISPPSLSNGDSNGAPATSEASPGILPSPAPDGSPVLEPGSTDMNDYLFVAYCPGSPQSCPCGDECACVGCMIHGQPAPMTPVTPP
ncbi:hypothetical protein GGS24DRAFT_489075 [Hypoxylon argillaceum]|nr:hypothetical protein GGS24DRAFT_489075 [Hypoxylon argillaceum]